MISLVFSYSHVDEALRNELEKHLSPLTGATGSAMSPERSAVLVHQSGAGLTGLRYRVLKA